MTEAPKFNAATYIERFNRRCLTELDWNWRDAGYLYPDAYDRLAEDEWAAEMRRCGIHE